MEDPYGHNIPLSVVAVYVPDKSPSRGYFKIDFINRFIHFPASLCIRDHMWVCVFRGQNRALDALDLQSLVAVHCLTRCWEMNCSLVLCKSSTRSYTLSHISGPLRTGISVDI